MSWYYPPYVPVAERRKKAAKKVASLIKKGQKINPVIIEGRVIAKTFWGKAWCQHLESYSDYDNRLPRGRTYVRNGSVIDLKLLSGEIKALVSGSEIYKVSVKIDPLPKNKWQDLVKECAGKIDSLIELLQGKFSKGVMEIVTHKEKGLFPDLKDLKLDCSCYDYADMCKHVAAVLYGIGAHLDEYPQSLFLLREVDHTDLLTQAGSADLSQASADHDTKTLTGDLSSLFGIDIEGAGPVESDPVIHLDYKEKKPPTDKKKSVKKTTARRKAKTIVN